MKQPKYKHIALVQHLKSVENASLHKCAFQRGQANCLWRPHLSTSFWQSWPRSGCYEKPAGSWYGQCETVSPSKLHIDLVRLTQLLVICSIFPPPINRSQNGFICSPVLALIWQNCPSSHFSLPKCPRKGRFSQLALFSLVTLLWLVSDLVTDSENTNSVSQWDGEKQFFLAASALICSR